MGNWATYHKLGVWSTAAASLMLAGCNGGTYETDVTAPGMIVQTNTKTGEIRACAIIGLIEEAARALHVSEGAAGSDSESEGRMSDEELSMRERAIMEREAARRSANDNVSQPTLVECTEWAARG